MKKGLTELVFILDRSGSMGGLESDTIGGFNSMIARQRETEGEVNVTTVLFDDRYEVIHSRFPLEAVKPMTEEDYYVRGCTALLDAIGRTIDDMGNILKHLPEEMRAEKVIFVITTDGLENASRRYRADQIRKMIEHQKEKYGWEFLFLGANMDAVSEARRFGIHESRSVRYENDSEGVRKNYDVLGKTLCAMRRAPRMADMDASWKKEIEDDYAERGGKKPGNRR